MNEENSISDKQSQEVKVGPKTDAGDKLTDDEAQTLIKEAIDKQAREDEQPLSSNLTLSKILGGDILNSRLMRRYVGVMAIAVVFIVIYIANGYSCQKRLVEIDTLSANLQKAKYRALATNSRITEKCRESHILEMLKNNKDSALKIPTQPPYLINVPAQ